MQHKRYYPVLIMLAAVLLTACGDNNKQEQAFSDGELEGFEISAVTKSEYQIAIKKDNFGAKIEEGYVLNGKKSGTWITYNADERIKAIENYIDGRVEGLSLQFDNRGQIIHKAFYKDGQFHGPNTTYKYGRPQETIPYTHGNVDGMVVRYYNNGKVMEEIDFKNGVQHGFYNHYNENEKLDMRYEYKDGEKVSGGMVEPD